MATRKGQGAGKVGNRDFLIFARRKYEEPLKFLKTTETLPDLDSSQNSEKWIEVIAVPRAAVVQVIPDEE